MRGIKVKRFAWLCAWALSCMPLAANATSLHAPFDTRAVASPAKPKSFTCPEIPDPIVSLATPSSYRQDDLTRSEYDHRARQDYLRRITPLRKYQQQVVKLANLYRTGRHDPHEVAGCVRSWLISWAQAGALGDLASDTARLHIGQSLAALSFAMLQVEQDAAFDQEARMLVHRWLGDLANEMMHFVNARLIKPSSNNNIRYWNGLGATATGVLTQNQEMFEWGMNSARTGIRQIAADGTLPLELARASRARHYHFFAAAPLFAIASIGKANGIDLYQEENGALHRLAKILVQNVVDSTFFEKETGVAQAPQGRVAENLLSGLYLYHLHFPSEESMKLFKREDSLNATQLGGDVHLWLKNRY